MTLWSGLWVPKGTPKDITARLTGRITWTAKLAPGQTAELAYSWYYYWR